MADAAAQLTQILSDLSAGDPSASDRLAAAVYDELHRLATAQLRRERRGHTLQPTAIVHEAFLRLLPEGSAQYENRAHFFGAAAQAMRRILVEHARSRHAQKRGGDALRVPLEQLDAADEEGALRVLAVDEALERLQALDDRKRQIIEMRFFAGMSVLEIAQALDITPRTIQREWNAAKAWLARELI